MAKIKLPHITTSFRALGYDFRQNDTKLDLVSHGPYAGIEVTFLVAFPAIREPRGKPNNAMQKQRS
jgi:hypothetical protein